MYSSVYRRLLLPLFDRVLKRRKTLAYWAAFEKSQWLSRAELESRQLAALRDLLCHAQQTCPWYARRWTEAGLDASQLQSLADLARWPLLTREDIKFHRHELRTSLPMELIEKTTGGSSGAPLVFDLNSDSNDRRTALMWRGYQWGGGEPGTRQLYVWGGALASTPLWKRWKLAAHAAFDHRRVINCFEFTPEKMRQHVKTLNRYRPKVIVAYTTPLYEFARYLDETRQSVWSPKSILLGAEKVHSFQRELMERVFQAPVFETYGSREFMLIGAECDRHTGLHLSLENLYVEVVDDEGCPTPPGEEGNVVVTDLFNYGMPFIRYVNGDRAVAGWADCPCGRGLPLLRKVTGRQLDTLETPDGRKVPGEFFVYLLKDFPAVRRFQIVQPAAEIIRVRLVAPDLRREEKETIETAIRAIVGWAIQLEIDQVDEIALTKAGKLKVVVKEATGAADVLERTELIVPRVS